MDIQTKDGILLRNIPDGTPDEEIKARIAKIRGAPAAEAPEVPAEAPAKPATSADLVAGSKPGRFALGVASPLMGLAQGMEDTVQRAPMALPAPITIPMLLAAEVRKRMGAPSADDVVKGVEEAKKRGMEAHGTEGFDWMGLAGSMVSPPVAKVASAIKAAPTALGRILQGTALGGGVAAAQPVTEGDYAQEKPKQIAEGAAIGAAIPGGVETGKGLYRGIRNVIDPWLPGGIDRAVVKTANEAAGSKRDAVIQALQENRQIVPGSRPNAGEAAADVGSAEFSGLQRAVEYRKPSDYVARAEEQEAARRAAIRGIGKDKASLQAAEKARNENATELYGAVRHERIGPESNAQIMERAIKGRASSKASALQDQGRFATTAAQQEELASNFVPVEGMPRVPGRLSNNAERVPEAQVAAADAGTIASGRRAEEAFLESTMERLRDTVGMENRSLTELLRRPSMRAAMQDSIKSAQETGQYFPRKADEKFSVQNLQRIKESLDAGIRTAKASADAGKRPELSPAELEGTKKAFVEWLSSRSPGWKQARLQYAEDSIPINRMQVGQELEKSLTNSLGTAERPAAFATAVREAPRTIKRATGNPRFDELGEVLAPPEVGAVQNVLSDLKRSATHEQLAQAGVPQARELLGQMAPKIPSAGMFSPHYSVIRALINRVEGRVTGKGVERLAEAMQDPELMARLMRDTPPAQRSKVVEALVRLGIVGGATAAAQ